MTKLSTSRYFIECEKFVSLQLPELLEMSKPYNFKVPEDMSTNFALGNWQDKDVLWFTCSYALFKRAEQAVAQTGMEVTNLAAVQWLAQNTDVIWNLHDRTVHAKMI